MYEQTSHENANDKQDFFKNEDIYKTKYKFSYANIPEDVSEDELARDWNLNGREFILISSLRTENRTWASFSLCVLRKYGRLPKVNEKPCYAIQMWFNKILNLKLDHPLVIPERDKTRQEILSSIKSFLGYEDFDDKVEDDLGKWATEQACQGLSEITVRNKILPLLKSWHIIPPSPTQLEEKFSSIWQCACEKVFNLVASRLTYEVKNKIDDFLEVSGETGKSKLFSLKDENPIAKPKIIKKWIEKTHVLDSLNLSSINLNCISSNLAREFSENAKKYDAYDLRRLRKEKRWALTVCYLIHSHRAIFDQIIQMNDICLLNFERVCRNEFNKKMLKRKKLSYKSKKIVIDYVWKTTTPIKKKEWSKLEQFTNIDLVEQAANELEGLANFEERGFLDECIRRYTYLRQYMQSFLSLPFESQKGSEDIIKAIEFDKKINESNLRNLPPDTSIQFLKTPWKQAFEASYPNERFRIWEIGLLFTVRDRLKSGDIFIRASSKFRPFWEMVFPETDWKEKREQQFEKLKIPKDFSIVRDKLIEEFNKVFNHFKNTLNENKFIKEIKDGKIYLSKDYANKEDKEIKKLRKAIERSLPLELTIEKLLEDVDKHLDMTGFIISKTREGKKWQKKRHVILAAMLAQATNIGPTVMAKSANDITLTELNDCIRDCLTEKSLRDLIHHQVKFHLDLPFTKNYGTGDMSSGDGQRFAVRQGSIETSLCTRYFGFYKYILNVYTNILNNLSVFSTDILPCRARESQYMLNGIFASQHVVQPKIHTSDTHGYTEQIFAIAYLVGITFAPRLKDLGGIKLFRIFPKQDLGDDFNSLLSDVANIDSIAPHWDDMIRVISALKEGHVLASDIMPKLGAGIHIDKLSQAFNTFGKIVKTIFLLRYLLDTDFRRMIRKQLNKGEHRHSLSDHVFFANKGEFCYGDRESLICQSTCLSSVCNSILIWNTIEYDKIVVELKSSGFDLKEKYLSHISPLMHKHIRINGKYEFDLSINEEEVFQA
jgi:TnpA family transposase